MTTTPHTTPPTPVATGEAAFVDELRRLKTWSGLSFRQLERRADAAGGTLPASTAATMLGKNRLPRAELLVTFVRACGIDEDGLRHWVDVRASLADGTAHAPEVGVVDGGGSSRRRVPSRWRWALAAAAVAVAVAGGAAFPGGAESTVDDETVVLAP